MAVARRAAGEAVDDGRPGSRAAARPASAGRALRSAGESGLIEGSDGACHLDVPDDVARPEPWGPQFWVTKRQLADRLQVSRRWIELQQRLGLPYLRMGGMNRYIVSEVEAWLREHYASTAPAEDS